MGSGTLPLLVVNFLHMFSALEDNPMAQDHLHGGDDAYADPVIQRLPRAPITVQQAMTVSDIMALKKPFSFARLSSGR